MWIQIYCLCLFVFLTAYNFWIVVRTVSDLFKSRDIVHTCKVKYKPLSWFNFRDLCGCGFVFYIISPSATPVFNLADPHRHVDTRRRRAKPPLAQQQHQMSPSTRSGSRLTIIPTNKSRQIAITVLTPGCLFTPSRRVSFSPSLPVRPALWSPSYTTVALCGNVIMGIVYSRFTFA